MKIALWELQSDDLTDAAAVDAAAVDSLVFLYLEESVTWRNVTEDSLLLFHMSRMEAKYFPLPIKL